MCRESGTHGSEGAGYSDVARLPDAERGWQVRQGERGTPGFFYKKIEIGERGEGSGSTDATGERKVIPLLRSFTLFHASQIDGIPAYTPPTLEQAPWREPEAVAMIARNSRAVIRTGGDRAFYSPGTDHVQMPPLAAFRSPSAYANVLSHELAHWSGAESRLDRDLRGRFGSQDYAREEMRAEWAQVMMCSELKHDDCDFTNGAAYIAEWLHKLRDDSKEVFRAASDAQPGLFNALLSSPLSLICNRCGANEAPDLFWGFSKRRISDSWDGNRVGGCRGRVFAVAGRIGGCP